MSPGHSRARCPRLSVSPGGVCVRAAHTRQYGGNDGCDAESSTSATPLRVCVAQHRRVGHGHRRRDSFYRVSGVLAVSLVGFRLVPAAIASVAVAPLVRRWSGSNLLSLVTATRCGLIALVAVTLGTGQPIFVALFSSRSTQPCLPPIGRLSRA